MKRTIITIDEEKCTGCGECVPGCPEGALQIIEGKARLVADYFCDGLGACIGECPEGALSTERREAQPYNEREAFANIIEKGPAVIQAHLAHLHQHGEKEYLQEALDECRSRGITVPDYMSDGCLSRMNQTVPRDITTKSGGDEESCLGNWPIQLKLVSPQAPWLRKADLLLAADCTAFAYGNLHRDYMAGRVAIILCPKLDPYGEEYIEKLAHIIGENEISSITIVRMQVPCCGGLSAIVKAAVQRAGISLPVTENIVGINGEIL